MDSQRGEWSSKTGFILAGAGSAIGLGNIWRFPYIVGENGGAVFVLLYLFFVILIGLPYMLAEFSLGRATQLNAIGAIRQIKPKSPWAFAGILGLITGIGILSFYGVIAGWTVGYIYKSAIGDFGGFGDFVSNPVAVILLFAVFMLLTASVVSAGVKGGIERWSKILMPLLLVLLLGLIFFALSLEGASEGLDFYLKPDFSKFSGSMVLAALGQAFFSLSLGMGLMVTYGSYLKKTHNIVSSAIWICIFDVMIALMAGMIIFPALFALGGEPASGPSLVFVVLPQLFATMPSGELFGALFFILLSVAALTSTISLLEVPVCWLVDEKKYKRTTIVWIVAGVIFIIGVPSALSQGASEFFTNFGLISSKYTSADFLSQMSFTFGDIFLTFGALMLSIFIGWIWGAKNAADEIATACKSFSNYSILWQMIIKYFIPIVIFVILLNLLGVFR